MTDYISREAAIKAVQEWFDTDGLNLDNLVDAVKMLPGTYVAPVGGTTEEGPDR